jgi:hypothetical protein
LRRRKYEVVAACPGILVLAAFLFVSRASAQDPFEIHIYEYEPLSWPNGADRRTDSSSSNRKTLIDSAGIAIFLCYLSPPREYLY